MYVIGYGEVEKNRLNINYSTDELLDDCYDNFVRANMVTVRNQQTGHGVPLSTEERRNDNKVSIEKSESGGRFVGLTESFSDQMLGSKNIEILPYNRQQPGQTVLFGTDR